MARPLQLGLRAVRADGGWARGEPVVIDGDTLVRHAFVCGASGFGKTVFCKGLVEEAVLAGIPVIAVDFKGDLASLALHGPLATAKGLRSIFGEEASAVATEFEAGAVTAGLDTTRARAYTERSFVRIFTPNSSLGRRVALSALPSFPEPVTTPLEREERDELIQALVLGFAHAMYGTSAAVKKNEPAVKVIEELVRWCADRGEPLDGSAGIARILELVGGTPFEVMGGMSIDEYLPNRDKLRLMQKLNSRLLGAERTRYEGQRLTVETLLGGIPEGKTPLSVVYLGHISDFAEQSAVLGQLCADIYRWMRKAGGSSGVRLLVYVDELGGGDAKNAFYPSAPHNPPSKAPLNLLVRQGRSAGIAMLLATQNPVSVDVRGLGNINTWAIGRLTRRNDHARVEDLLNRMPGGLDEGIAAVSQLPQGMMIAMSDALDGPQYVHGRWLYSVHRQLSPGSVGAICAQMAPAIAAEPLQEPSVRLSPKLLDQPKISEIKTVETAPKAKPSEVKTVEKTLRAKPSDIKTVEARFPRAKTAEATKKPRKRAPAGEPPPKRPTLVPAETEEIPAFEEDEETSAGMTIKPARAPEPQDHTDAIHTAAAHAEQPTVAALVRIDTDALLLDADDPTEEATVLHPTRKPRRRREEPIAAEEDDDTGVLLADELLGNTMIHKRPATARKEPEVSLNRSETPEQTRWYSAKNKDESPSAPVEESSTKTLPPPKAISGRWILRAGPCQWVIGTLGLTVGRSPHADAQIADPHISRLHLQLQTIGTTLIVRGLNAKNPTWIEGKTLNEPLRFEPRGAEVVLKLGDTDVRLAWEDPAG